MHFPAAWRMLVSIWRLASIGEWPKSARGATLFRSTDPAKLRSEWGNFTTGTERRDARQLGGSQASTAGSCPEAGDRW